MLKLMYITNDPTVAKIAADAGVDRIFIDMEVLGKAERQGGMDTVQSHHTPEDIAKVRAAIGDQAEIMARVNPLNPNSQTEIDDAIANSPCGALRTICVGLLAWWMAVQRSCRCWKRIRRQSICRRRWPYRASTRCTSASTTCTCAIIRNSCSSS